MKNQPSQPAILWHLAHYVQLPEDNHWLSPREQEVLSGLRFEKRRNDWRLGRWTAKNALRGYFPENLPPADIEIIAAEDGAPEVFLGGQPAPCVISLSHSGGRGFCVVAGEGIALGCDVEMLEPRPEIFREDYFTPEEQRQVAALSAEEQTLGMNLVWSAKESALKALREGLRRDTRSVSVDFRYDPRPETWHPLLVTVQQEARRFYGWWRGENGVVLTAVTGTSPLPLISCTDIKRS